MRILVLNGSPKRDKSDTMHITRAFLKGMDEAAQQEIHTIHVIDRHNFEPAEAQFKLCFPGNHTIITVPESPMFNAPEAAIVTKPRLALVKQAGAQYAKDGMIDAALLQEIGSPMIPEEQYAAIVNGGV